MLWQPFKEGLRMQYSIKKPLGRGLVTTADRNHLKAKFSFLVVQSLGGVL
jgi:hypothetical protein